MAIQILAFTVTIAITVLLLGLRAALGRTKNSDIAYRAFFAQAKISKPAPQIDEESINWPNEIDVPVSAYSKESITARTASML